jgi:hypothetical protein
VATQRIDPLDELGIVRKSTQDDQRPVAGYPGGHTRLPSGAAAISSIDGNDGAADTNTAPEQGTTSEHTPRQNHGCRTSGAE